MNLEHILGSLARVRVLRALFSKDGVSGRNVSARARVSPSSGKAALDELAAWGIVLKVPSGKRHVYEINQSHAFTEPLARLFAREYRYLERLGLKVGRLLRGGQGAPLRAVGVDAEGRVTLLLTPPLPSDREVHRRVHRLLWFSFGLRLAAVTTDPSVVRKLERVWVAEPGAMRAGDQDIRELVHFFELSE
ncbi:MAG: hypothetical protein GXP50_10465 [Deltaproteobacteria bacterium]|nr:hypothetical protein [Deltaproteobacteria bacterium]